eukprot:c5259_g1_i1.p1 GENE.c5259_g1_i1~~c5259_g1_i1.p1  ORF type:complete len:351 (+),score=51.50 c5259_g1_i1:146-1054(+)
MYHTMAAPAEAVVQSRSECDPCSECLDRCVESFVPAAKWDTCMSIPLDHIHSACQTDPSCAELLQVYDNLLGPEEDMSVAMIASSTLNFLNLVQRVPRHSRLIFLSLLACESTVLAHECLSAQIQCHADNTPAGCRDMMECSLQSTDKCSAEHIQPCVEQCQGDGDLCMQIAQRDNSTSEDELEAAYDVCDQSFVECQITCSDQSDFASCTSTAFERCRIGQPESVYDFYQRLQVGCEGANSVGVSSQVLDDCAARCSETCSGQTCSDPSTSCSDCGEHWQQLRPWTQQPLQGMCGGGGAIA